MGNLKTDLLKNSLDKSSIESDFAKLDNSLRFNANFEIESKELSEDVSIFPGSTGKSGMGIRHIIEERFKRDNLSQDEITALTALILESVKKGKITRESDYQAEFTKNGIVAIVRKDYYGKEQNWILTGFAYDESDLEKNREATETIKTVIANYSNSDGYSYFRNQVGAVIASLDSNIAQTMNKSTVHNFVQNNEVYGFAYEGKIYLNPDIMTSEVALHEYTHLWDAYIQETNPEVWNKGKNILKNIYLWNEIKNNSDYADIADNEDLVASEVHSRICGKMADAILTKIAEHDGELTKDTVIDWDKEVDQYIYDNFKSVRTSANVNEIRSWFAQPMKDFMNGVNITQSVEQKQKSYSWNEIYVNAIRQDEYYDGLIEATNGEMMTTDEALNWREEQKMQYSQENDERGAESANRDFEITKRLEEIVTEIKNSDFTLESKYENEKHSVILTNKNGDVIFSAKENDNIVIPVEHTIAAWANDDNSQNAQKLAEEFFNLVYEDGIRGGYYVNAIFKKGSSLNIEDDKTVKVEKTFDMLTAEQQKEVVELYRSSDDQQMLDKWQNELQNFAIQNNIEDKQKIAEITDIAINPPSNEWIENYLKDKNVNFNTEYWNDIFAELPQNIATNYVDDKKISDWNTISRNLFPIEVLQSENENILTKSALVNKTVVVENNLNSTEEVSKNPDISYFVKSTAEFDQFEDFKPITALSAEQAIEKYAELQKKNVDCGIGINIKNDSIFDDKDADGITVLVRKNGKDTFNVYGDTFVKQLKETNEHSQNVIAAFEELYNEAKNAGLSIEDASWIDEKKNELFDNQVLNEDSINEHTFETFNINPELLNAVVNEELDQIENSGERKRLEENAVEKDDNVEIELTETDLAAFKAVVPRSQYISTLEYINDGEESDFFKSKIKDIATKVRNAPKLYETDGAEEHNIVLRYFHPSGTEIFITEIDKNGKEAFGYQVLNDDYQMAEFGYIDIDEVKNIGLMEVDFHIPEGMTLERFLYNQAPEEYPQYEKFTQKEQENNSELKQENSPDIHSENEKPQNKFVVTESVTFPCNFAFPANLNGASFEEHKKYVENFVQGMKSNVGDFGDEYETEIFTDKYSDDFNVNFTLQVPKDCVYPLKKTLEWKNYIVNRVESQYSDDSVQIVFDEGNSLTKIFDSEEKVQEYLTEHQKEINTKCKTNLLGKNPYATECLLNDIENARSTGEILFNGITKDNVDTFIYYATNLNSSNIQVAYIDNESGNKQLYFRNLDNDENTDFDKSSLSVLYKFAEQVAENDIEKNLDIIEEEGNFKKLTEIFKDSKFIQDTYVEQNSQYLSIGQLIENEVNSVEFTENIFDFKNSLNEYFEKGIRPENDRFIIGKTPLVLQKTGSDITEVTVPVSVIKKAVETHGLSKDEITRSLLEIYNPILIFDSDKNATENKVDSKLILTNVFKDEKPLALAVNVNSDVKLKDSNISVEVQDIRSIHDRTVVANNETDLIQKWTNDGLCRYINDKKISDWRSLARIYFPIELMQSGKANVLKNSSLVNKNEEALFDFLLEKEKVENQKRIERSKEELSNPEYQDQTDDNYSQEEREYIERLENLSEEDFKNTVRWKLNIQKEFEESHRQLVEHMEAERRRRREVQAGELFAADEGSATITVKNQETGREISIQPSGNLAKNVMHLGRLKNLSEANLVIAKLKSKGLEIASTEFSILLYDDEKFYEFADGTSLTTWDFKAFIKKDLKITKRMKDFLKIENKDEQEKPDLKTYHTLTEEDVENLEIISDEDFSDIVDSIILNDYRHIPKAIRLPNINEQLAEKIGLEKDSAFIMKRSATHIRPDRKGSYDQALSTEEYYSIPKVIREATFVVVDKRTQNFQIIFDDNDDIKKINKLVFNKDKLGNYLVTVGKVDRRDGISEKNNTVVAVGVAPTISALRFPEELPATRLRPSTTTVTESIPQSVVNASIENAISSESEPTRVGSKTKSEIKKIREQCREILKKSDSEITEEDKAILAQYEGAGGIKEDNRTDNGVLNEFYTPNNLVQKVWNIVDSYAPAAVTVLEPSAGVGHFAENRPNNQFTMHEIDPTSARINRILHPDAKIIEGAYQEQFFDENKRALNPDFVQPKYDVVIGNPPYGKNNNEWAGKGEGKEFDRAEEYFISKGLDALKDENSIMAFVVPSGFLNTARDKQKDIIAGKGKLIDAYRLPEGTFGTTEVGTDIIIMQNWEKERLEIKEKFPTANDAFKKATLRQHIALSKGMLSDNAYFNQHPEKILGEVQTRTNRFGKQEEYVAVHEGLTVQDELNKIDGLLPKTEEGLLRYVDDKKISSIAKEKEEHFLSPLAKLDTSNVITFSKFVNKQTTLNQSDKTYSLENYKGEAETFHDSLIKALDADSVKLPIVDYSYQNYDVLFSQGFVETPIETLKMGNNQFQKFNKPDRDYLLAAAYQTLTSPSLIFDSMSLDSKDGELKPVRVYGKSFYRENEDKSRAVESVVIFREENNIVIGTHNKDFSRFVKQIKTADQIIYADKTVSQLCELVNNGLAYVRTEGEITQSLNPNYNESNLLSIEKLIQDNKLSVKQTDTEKELLENDAKAENGTSKTSLPSTKETSEQLSIGQLIENEVNSVEFTENIFDFKNSLNEYFEKGIRPENDRFIIGKTPLVLQKTGSDITEVTVPVSVIKKAVETHGLSKDEITRSLLEIYNPILIFDSDKNATENKVDSKLILTNVFKDEKPLALAVNTNSSVDINNRGLTVEVQDIRSVHDRTVVANNGTDLIQKWTNDGLCRYVNDKKISDWSTVARVQFPVELLQSDNNNILTNSAIVNDYELSEEKIKTVETNSQNAIEQVFEKSADKVMSTEEFSRYYGKTYNKTEVELWHNTDWQGVIDYKKLSAEQETYIRNSQDYIEIKTGEYMHKAIFASGDIYKKISAQDYLIQTASNDYERELYTKNKELLMAAKKKEIPLEDIHVTLKSTLAEEYTVERFNSDGEGEKLNLQEAFILWAKNETLDHLNWRWCSVDYTTANISRDDFPENIWWGDIVNYIDGEIIKADKTRGGWNQTEEEINELKQQREAEANEKRQARKDTADKLFDRFIHNGLSKEEEAAFTFEYNKRFNSFVAPDYSKLPLYIDGMSKYKGDSPFKLYQQQVKGASFLCNKGNGLLAYDVGVGKTATGIVATINQIQSGRAKRPLVIVPKAVYTKWVNDFTQLFPNVQVNALGNLSDDFVKPYLDKEKPHSLKIPEGSVSVITETDASLGKITFSDESINGTLFNDFANLLSLDLGENNSDRENATNRQKIKDAIGAASQVNKQNYYFFEDCGWDNLTVDEAHRFKNLWVKPSATTRRESNEFAGIPSGNKPSKKALKLFAMTQLIQANNNGSNVFLLTATPFTNSPLEVYSMLSYIARERLHEAGIPKLRDFLNEFAQTKFEMSVDSNNSIKHKQVMKSWKALPALQGILKEYIDKVDADEVKGLVRPYKVQHKVALEMTPLQQKLRQADEALMSSAKAGNLGATLVAMTNMRINTIAPALANPAYYPNIELPPRNQMVETSPKLKFVCDTVADMYNNGNQDKGQFIYLPLGKDAHGYIKNYLVEKKGVPADAIEIINGEINNQQEKKDAITRKFNDPKEKLKILIGGFNTSEGIDLNGNSFVMYNCSLGWNPSETVQAEGRIHRQGNLQGVVHTVYPLINDSIDSVLFEKHSQKKARIDQLFKAEGNEVEVEDTIDPEKLKIELIKDPIKRASLIESEASKDIRISLSKVNLKIKSFEEIAEANIEAKNSVHGYQKTVLSYEKQEKEFLTSGLEVPEYLKSDIKHYKEQLRKSNTKLQKTEEKLNSLNLKTQEERDSYLHNLNEQKHELEERLKNFTTNELPKLLKELEEKRIEEKITAISLEKQSKILQADILGNLRPMEEVRQEVMTNQFIEMLKTQVKEGVISQEEFDIYKAAGWQKYDKYLAGEITFAELKKEENIESNKNSVEQKTENAVSSVKQDSVENTIENVASKNVDDDLSNMIGGLWGKDNTNVSEVKKDTDKELSQQTEELQIFDSAFRVRFNEGKIDPELTPEQLEQAQEVRNKIIFPQISETQSGMYKAFNDFATGDVFDIVGKSIDMDGDYMTVTGVKQLQSAMEIYRNKNFETFRYIMIDRKTGEIADQLAVSSCMPNSSSIDDKVQSILKSVIQQADVNNYAVVIAHNHPSGKVEPSLQDRQTTKAIEQALTENNIDFAGHIILDHSTFSFYDPKDRQWSLITNIDKSLEEDKFVKQDFVLKDNVILNNVDLSNVAKKINDNNNWNDNFIPVVFTNSNEEVSGIKLYDKSFFERFNAEFIRNRMQFNGLEVGASKAYPIVTNAFNKTLSFGERKNFEEKLTKLVEGNAFTDVALPKGKTLASKQGINTGKELYSQKNAVVKGIQSTFVRKVEQNIFAAKTASEYDKDFVKKLEQRKKAAGITH